MSINLSKKRKGEIALIILSDEIKNSYISLNRKNLEERINENAPSFEEKGVSREEVVSLYEEIVRESIEEIFCGKKE